MIPRAGQTAALGPLAAWAAREAEAPKIVVGSNKLTSRDGDFPHVEHRPPRPGAAAAILLLCLMAACASGKPDALGWRPAPNLERLLPGSADDWEPALSLGLGDAVYVTAGHRPGANESSQRVVFWRSEDGERFEGPRRVDEEGSYHGDQRVAVDGQGVVYVSYLEAEAGLLRLARSEDEGRSFLAQTVTDQHVSDKPELAVSPDGRRLYIAYESRPGPRLIASQDGGWTWGEGRVIVPSEGRHFWPTGLVLGPDGELWLSALSVPDADIQSQNPTTTTLHVFRSADAGESWRDFEFGRSPWVPRGCAHVPDCRVKVSYIGVAVDGKGRAFVAYTEGREPSRSYALFFRSTADGGRTWTAARRLSSASRPKSKDEADYDYAHVAAEGDGRVCVVWVDDRLGGKNVWARCSRDAGASWDVETLLSNRPDGASYKSAEGFETYFGDYGGVALSTRGRLYAAWGEGSRGNGSRGEGTGAIWLNRFDAFGAPKGARSTANGSSLCEEIAGTERTGSGRAR